VGHLFRNEPPYPASWPAVVHNRLRLAFIHFAPARVERVVRALRAYEAFPAGMAMMLDSDVLARRSLMAGERRFDDEWFFRKFELTC